MKAVLHTQNEIVTLLVNCGKLLSRNLDDSMPISPVPIDQ